MNTPHRAVSVVIPCRNEADRILSTLESVLAWCHDHLDAHEVIVVDDGSSDDTAGVVRSRYRDAVIVVELERNRGKGHAVRRGVERASLPLVLFLDADHAMPIDQLEFFLLHTTRYALVIGSKRHPDAQVARATHRELVGSLGQALIRLLVVPGVRDTQCGFKLLHTAVAQQLLAHQRIEHFGFDFELLFLARRFGYPILELPVRGVDVGDGSVGLASYLRTFGDLLHLTMLRLGGRYPARVATAREE